jgi:hypothetical protein
MIDHEDTEYSVATGGRKLVWHRMNGDLEGTCAVIRVRHQKRRSHHCVSGSEVEGERHPRLCIPAPYEATLILRAGWYTPDPRSWARLTPQSEREG